MTHPLGPWVVAGGAVAATGGIACVAGGCEALAGAAAIGGATAAAEQESLAEALTQESGAGATCEVPTVSVFHGSIRNGAEILKNGLDPARAPTFVSRDIAAAEDTLTNHPDRIPGAGMIIESRIPVPEFLKHLAPFERPYSGWYPYGIQSTEITLRTPEQIEVFNRFIAK